MNEARELLEAVQEAEQNEKRIALATVIRVFGSAYRREGSKMVVREDGVSACMISGGCLEPEIAERAKEVLARHQTQRITYSLDEDVVWGLGLGCGGKVEVLIEPVEPGPLREYLQLWGTGEPAALVTDLKDFTRWLLRPGQGEGAIGEKAQELFRSPHPRPGLYDIEGRELYFDVSLPPPQLFIFGAGHDARPLSSLALELGFRVTVIDPRPAFANPENFPGARILLAHPGELEGRLHIDERSYIVVMNHHLTRDEACLRFALTTPAAYIGLLGPRSRLEQFHSLQDTSRIRNPIGLDLGAEGPQEVALSILGEIIALSRGHRGGFLHGRSGRIHDPS